MIARIWHGIVSVSKSTEYLNVITGKASVRSTEAGSGSNSRLNCLFLKCRREFNKAFSNLCRRPGGETEHECRLEFRLHAKK
jgi:hypothetical protein